MNETETAVQRLNTKAFIDADYVMLVLTPQVRQNTGTGVKFVDLPDRVSQRFKLIRMAPGQKPFVTLDGEQRIADFTLLGYYDATIARYDYWVDGQYRYEIIELAPTCDYEVKALVERRG